jgi:hypothetical protein
MAIRDSQDVTLVGAQNKGAPRVSQDVTLAPAQNKGKPRDSQDVILVLARRYSSGPIVASQAQQSLAATGHTSGTVILCSQASQSLAATGTIATARRDSQDVTLVASQNIGHPRDSQDLTLALAQNIGHPRVSQDVILILSPPRVQIVCDQAPQSADATGTLSARVKTDRPDRQLHPVVKPLDFLSRPLTQAGRRSATFTTVLTPAGASRAFSMPLGGRNRPIAGRVFTFTMGGSLVLGTVGGTLIITPFYGATADGISLGSSALCPYSADYATPTQWRLKGEIVFQQVDFAPGSSLVTCQGAFIAGGDPKIPGSGLTIVFGSAGPVAVDADAVTPSASGALNFAATFAPASLNAVAPVISTKYALLRS